MYRLAICAAVSVCIGCGKSEPAVAEVAAKELSKLQAHADKVVAKMDEQKAEEEKLKADLAADPSPVAELALKQARSGFAKSFGDAAATTASITVAPSTIKTFGGEKWTVRGAYDGKDANGEPRTTAWESTVRLMFGKLQVQSLDLDASN